MATNKYNLGQEVYFRVGDSTQIMKGAIDMIYRDYFIMYKIGMYNKREDELSLSKDEIKNKMLKEIEG